MTGKKDKSRLKPNKARHYFFLNPYEDMAFTRCPKCEQKTRIRKHCLVIHIEPSRLFTLNKTCRYCPRCDLIIVKQAEFESLLVAICEEHAPDVIGNDYFVFGTMDRKDWKRAQTEKPSPQEAIERSYPFKDIWKFEVIPESWYLKENLEG